MFLTGSEFNCPKGYVENQDECDGHNGQFCKDCLQRNLELQLGVMLVKIFEEMPDDEKEELIARIQNRSFNEPKTERRESHEQR